jgi:hypothetical protein
VKIKGPPRLELTYPDDPARISPPNVPRTVPAACSIPGRFGVRLNAIELIIVLCRHRCGRGREHLSMRLHPLGSGCGLAFWTMTVAAGNGARSITCKNRHCPKCQNDQAEVWLENQKGLLLPVNYLMVTSTLPEELRPLARSHQKTVYSILFRASADALLELASDPRFVGARLGMVGVLHTWTRDLF